MEAQLVRGGRRRHRRCAAVAATERDTVPAGRGRQHQRRDTVVRTRARRRKMPGNPSCHARARSASARHRTGSPSPMRAGCGQRSVLHWRRHSLGGMPSRDGRRPPAARPSVHGRGPRLRLRHYSGQPPTGPHSALRRRCKCDTSRQRLVVRRGVAQRGNKRLLPRGQRRQHRSLSVRRSATGCRLNVYDVTSGGSVRLRRSVFYCRGRGCVRAQLQLQLHAVHRVNVPTGHVVGLRWGGEQG
jgi:hypothetical protein